MRTEMQLTNNSATIVGWLVAQESRLHRSLQLLALRRALRKAHARFAQTNQTLVESLFDAHFVQTRVAPLLAQALEHNEVLRPEQIAEAWFAGIGASNARRSEEALASLRTAAAELLNYVERELQPEQQQMAPVETVETDATAAALFAQAVQTNSNLELDWLWLYTKMTGAYERSYCLQKALEINPASELIRELRRFEQPALPAALLPATEF